MNISPYSAPPARDIKDIDCAEREKLYAWTEQQATALERQYEEHKDNPEILAHLFTEIQEGFKSPPEWQLNMLGEWIAANTSYCEGPGMNFVGAYAPLQRISSLKAKIQSVSSSAMEVEQVQAPIPQGGPDIKGIPGLYAYDHALSVLANIDRCALFHIEKMNSKISFHHPSTGDENCPNETGNEILYLIEDIQKRIFSYVRSKDLLNLTCTDKRSKQLALNELDDRMEKGLVNLDKELHLSMQEEEIDWNKIANRFIDLKHLSITGMHPEIKDLKSKFTSVVALDLKDIFDQEVFNLTLENFPSIERLGCFTHVLPFEYNFSTNKIKNFGVLKNCPSLKTIKFEGDFKSIQGLDKCTSLEKIIFINCIRLENIEALANLPNLTHLTIYKGGISEINFHLPRLEYLYIGSQYIFNTFEFLTGSPNLETLIVDDDCLDVGQLDHVRSIQTLKLISFSNSIIPGIKKCTSLKTLVLDKNVKKVPLNLSELNQCTSLETLGLENCNLADISVLSAHPSLKSLCLFNCSDIPEETMALFETNGIKIFSDATIELPPGGL